jgi:hypothetical protein
MRNLVTGLLVLLVAVGLSGPALAQQPSPGPSAQPPERETRFLGIRRSWFDHECLTMRRTEFEVDASSEVEITLLRKLLCQRPDLIDEQRRVDTRGDVAEAFSETGLTASQAKLQVRRMDLTRGAAWYATRSSVVPGRFPTTPTTSYQRSASGPSSDSPSIARTYRNRRPSALPPGAMVSAKLRLTMTASASAAASPSANPRPIRVGT